MEAVKQGSATVGLKSSTHAVLVALKRASSELAAHQKKIKPLDEHIAVSISGISYFQIYYSLLNVSIAWWFPSVLPLLLNSCAIIT